MQEILVIAMIALAIFFLPRLWRPPVAPQPAPQIPRVRTILTGRARLVILITVLWVLGAAALLTPWRGDVHLFLLIGLGPALLFWGAIWVLIGFRRYRR